VKYSFITQQKNTYPVRLMCKTLGVSRNGYYHYAKVTSQKQDLEREALRELVVEISKDNDRTYGSRRVKEALRAKGHCVGRHKARNLMEEACVSVLTKKKFKVTTDSAHSLPLFDNVLNREFAVGRANRAYVGDITYIWTNEGWLYLAVVIDLFSRKVIGWSMSSRMKATLVCDALAMAIATRETSSGLICHSDRGSQYASKAYRKLLSVNQFVGSMSRKANCWDNSVAESFFGSLKQERVHWRHYQTRSAAQQDILAYITMHYNEKRLHSYLGYVSPNEFERQSEQLPIAA